MSDVLSVADVAKLRGIGRVAAYRWLLRNAKEYLRRSGRFVVISAEDYAKLGRAPIDDRILDRFARMEDRLAEGERRLDAHAKALAHIHAL